MLIFILIYTKTIFKRKSVKLTKKLSAKKIKNKTVSKKPSHNKHNNVIFNTSFTIKIKTNIINKISAFLSKNRITVYYVLSFTKIFKDHRSCKDCRLISTFVYAALSSQSESRPRQRPPAFVKVHKVSYEFPPYKYDYSVCLYFQLPCRPSHDEY